MLSSSQATTRRSFSSTNSSRFVPLKKKQSPFQPSEQTLHFKVYLFPQTEETSSSFTSLASKLHFPLLAPGRVLGHQIDATPSFTGKHIAYTTYTTVLPPGARVLRSFYRPAGEVVASLGKVLGDRSTLYKYLNPNIVGYITERDFVPLIHGEAEAENEKEKAGRECGVVLVDGAKGTLLYHANLPAARGSCESVHAVITENWLVYTYWDGDVVSELQAKGQKVVSVELYEGTDVDDKTRRRAQRQLLLNFV